MIIEMVEQLNNQNAKGQFVVGNNARHGPIRGVKRQLALLRNTIFDALLEPIDSEGHNRLEEAIRSSKSSELLALAAKLIPKAVELTLGGEAEPVPIVLDVFPVRNGKEAIEKPVSPTAEANGRKAMLGLLCVDSTC